MNDDDFDITSLRIGPASPTPPPVPAKIRKRREQFIIMPVSWYEKLANPEPKSIYTCLVALYLLHLHWKNHGKPFKLPNGMLKYDGVDRFGKYRALVDLEQRQLISVERRDRRSPLVHVHGAGT